MLTIAEISDKMPTPFTMWTIMSVLSVPLIAAAAFHRWSALASLAIAVAVSGFFLFAAYQQAYLEGSFSESVWLEMGGGWVAHSFASALLPLVSVLIIAILKWLKHRPHAH